MEVLEGARVGVTEKKEAGDCLSSQSRNRAPAATYHFDFLVTSLFIRCDSVAFEISPAAPTRCPHICMFRINDFPP